MQFIRLLTRLQEKQILVNLFCLIAARTVGPLHLLTQQKAPNGRRLQYYVLTLSQK